MIVSRARIRFFRPFPAGRTGPGRFRRPARFPLAAAALLAVTLAGPASSQTLDFDGKVTGFLTVKTGGLPADAWAGTSLAAAKALVSALPAAPRSRALRDLQFTVMVSELTPPPPDGSPPPSLFVRKVEKLAAMGEGENLNEMVRSAGGYADPAVAAIVANAMMMAGERQGGCAIARSTQLGEPFAARADVACRLLAGETDAASGMPPLPVGQIDGPGITALDIGRGQVPAAVLRATQPPIMRALVALKSLPMATRIDIAERGEALAIIEATRLGDLYLEALRDGAPLPQAMARRAQLVAAARNAANPEEIARLLVAVYGDSRGGPLFTTIARATAASLLNLPAQPQFANLAQEVMRGFLLLGDRQQTQAWLRLALGAVTTNARAIIALDRLLPLVAVAGAEGPGRLGPPEINRWYELAREDDAARAPLRGYLLLELLRATGTDVPPGSTDLPESAPGNARLVMPSAATLQALANAAAGRRRAETALLASSAAGEIALNEIHPAGAAAIVQALRQGGDDYAARLFAIEVAIAYGL